MIFIWFNANVNFKLSLRCFKYLDIKKSDNNKVGKFKVSSHNSPQATPFLMHIERQINT
jgi:hypothetical protein